MKKLLTGLILILTLLPLFAAPKTAKNSKSQGVIQIKKGYTVPDWVKTALLGNIQQIKSTFDIPETRAVLIISSRENREELSKCSAVIDMYTQIIGNILSVLPGVNQNDESGSSLSNVTKLSSQVNGFSSCITAEDKEDGTSTFVRKFKSPFSFESEISSIESNSTVTTTYKYFVNGTEKTDKNITYADLAGLKNEFTKAFSDLAVKDEGFCTIGFTNTQKKESYYETYYVLSYDKSGFDKILQEQLNSMDQNLMELLIKSLN